MLDLSYEKMLEQITQVRRALVDLAGRASSRAAGAAVPAHQSTTCRTRPRRPGARAGGPGQRGPVPQGGGPAQIDAMEPQREQLTEEEEKLDPDPGRLQKRVNDFRTQKETLKAQYTAAKAIPRSTRARRDLEVLNRLGRRAPAGPGQDRHDAGPLGALDELLESGVLEDVGGGTDDIQKELDEVGQGRRVDTSCRAQGRAGHAGAARPRGAAAAPAESSGTSRRPPDPAARQAPGVPVAVPVPVTRAATTSASSAGTHLGRSGPLCGIVVGGCARAPDTGACRNPSELVAGAQR